MALLPNPRSRRAQLPKDAWQRDGATAERDGIKLSEIYGWSASDKIERVIIVVDAAFSGNHRDGTAAVSPRPPGPPKFVQPSDERMVVWMADKQARSAPHYRAADHGMFTYLVAGAPRTPHQLSDR